MAKITYTGTAGAWRSRAYDVAASNGETIDVDDDTADALVANEDFEHADDSDGIGEFDDESAPEYAVLADAIDDLESELDDGDHDDHLVDLRREEEAHKNRSGALEAIDERRRAVADAEGDAEADADADTEAGN